MGRMPMVWKWTFDFTVEGSKGMRLVSVAPITYADIETKRDESFFSPTVFSSLASKFVGPVRGLHAVRPLIKVTHQYLHVIANIIRDEHCLP
jgi:hypothetical protein